MTRKDKLLALAKRVESATAGDRSLDVEISVLLQIVGSFASGATAISACPDDSGWLLYDLSGEKCTDKSASYTTSIDDAMMLLPEGCVANIMTAQGKECSAQIYHFPGGIIPHVLSTSHATTPAVALAAAALKALVPNE